MNRETFFFLRCKHTLKGKGGFYYGEEEKTPKDRMRMFGIGDYSRFRFYGGPTVFAESKES